MQTGRIKNAQLTVYEVKLLKEQILGIRLLAQEMSDEVEIIRGMLQRNIYVEDELETRLARLDELIEPLLKGVKL
jgi:hypothetical protein